MQFLNFFSDIGGPEPKYEIINYKLMILNCMYEWRYPYYMTLVDDDVFREYNRLLIGTEQWDGMLIDQNMRYLSLGLPGRD